MAMPIDSYSVLRALDDFGRVPELREALEQFSLFAFVLHDPRHHPELDQTLAHELAHLDQVTGKKFLFFSLVEASGELRQRISDRHYFSALVEAMAKPNTRAQARPSRTSSLTAYCASRLLGLPAAHLPCIVVFLPDVADEFLYLPTSAATVVDHLSRLGRAAESLSSIRDIAGTRDVAILRQVCDGEGLPALPSHVPGRYRRRRRSGVTAVGQVLRPSELQSLIRDLARAASGCDGDDLSKERDELLLEWSTLVGLYQEKPVPWAWEAAPRKLWELESDAVLASAASLLRLPELLEFSPLVICYGKALEVELNASFVQELRERNGIEMPEFFRKHQPGKTVRLEVSGLPKPVNINKKAKSEYGNLAPPSGLGTIQQTAAAYGPSVGFSDEEWTEMLGAVQIVKSARNDAAHSRIVSYDKANACSRAFTRLVKDGYMHRLFETKLRLRGDDPGLPGRLAREAAERRRARP